MAAANFDLLVIGGGINGAGIARDAAGRGLSVLLVERDDLAAHTSSASTKLIHGGLRYLEYREFRLVRESLRERERLLHIAPHLIAPLRFVLPLPEGGRPAWMIRLGLWLYDRLGGPVSLPASRAVRLSDRGLAGILKPGLERGFAYSDCQVDDARLVVANAADAAARGATILTGVAVTGARVAGDVWQVDLAVNPARPAPAAPVPARIAARAIVNAAGPWAEDMLAAIPEAGSNGARGRGAVRLVKGSHLVVRRRWSGDHAYLFQNRDGRVLFAIPWQGEFTLIGTTDVPVAADERAAPVISQTEIDYLLSGANAFLAQPLTRADIVTTYAGVRPLFDDGAADAKAITRDYALRLGRAAGPQLLSVFGGKLTTYRRLAEHALDKLAPWLPAMSPAWISREPLPGGDLPAGGLAALAEESRIRWPFLGEAQARRLARAYGTRIAAILDDATSPADLGEDFGAGLSEAEVAYLAANEWARTAEDILWRRGKLGLVAPPDAAARIEAWLRRPLPAARPGRAP